MNVVKDPEPGLRSGVVGLLGAATLGVVMLSPAMTLYGNFGAAYVNAGKAAPLAFIFALLATIPTATSFALVSRRFPDSGTAASWTSRAISPDMGRWVGWMVFAARAPGDGGDGVEPAAILAPPRGWRRTRPSPPCRQLPSSATAPPSGPRRAPLDVNCPSLRRA